MPSEQTVGLCGSPRAKTEPSTVGHPKTPQEKDRVEEGDQGQAGVVAARVMATPYQTVAEGAGAGVTWDIAGMASWVERTAEVRCRCLYPEACTWKRY